MTEGDEWNGEGWLLFSLAAAEVEDQLGLSLGAAERTLRQLCASGDVRAIRCQVDNLGEPTNEEEPTFIAPSEWSAQVDHQDWVELSENDLRYWLNNHKPPKDDKQPRRRAKQALPQQAINDLWPNVIPEALTNKQIEKQVWDWITDYCKRENLPKPDISRDTILRAAGRK